MGEQALGLDTRIQRERQRIERVVAFSLEVARALRQELDGARASANEPWGDPLVERVNGRLAAVQSEAARCRSFLLEAPTAMTIKTLRTLETFELEPKGYRLVEVFSGDDRVRAAPFDAVEIELGALWAR